LESILGARAGPGGKRVVVALAHLEGRGFCGGRAVFVYDSVDQSVAVVPRLAAGRNSVGVVVERC